MLRSARKPITGGLARVGELAAHSIASGSLGAYFQAGDDKLTNPTKRRFFAAIEDDLQRLDAAAWAALKAEALPRLTTPALGRGWEGLFSILNQARGYKHLVELGCASIEFIPRGKGKTPDLRATRGTRRVLCEVKTIHISAAEVARRQSGGVVTTVAHVTAEFLGKLRRDLEVARAQMLAFDGAARHIAYVIVNFDDHFHEYAADYRADIEADLAANPTAGVEVALDIKPPFYWATRAA